MWRKLLKPDNIEPIPTGGYPGYSRCSKKAMMWLLHIEKIDGLEIKHARNGREYRLPEVPIKLWTVIVQIQIECTSFFGTGTTFSSSVT